MKKSILVVVAVVPLIAIVAAAVLMTAGDDGRRIAAISSSEPVALSWRGVWEPEAAYLPGQVVTHEGSSYVAESEDTGTSPTGTGCLRNRDCPWALMSSRGRQVKAALLDSSNPSTTLYNIPGVGRITASCHLGPNANASWQYTNTTSDGRFFSWQTVLAVGYSGSSGVAIAGQQISDGGDAFGDRLLVYPLDPATGTAPYIDVFLSGRVSYSPGGDPTSCQIRAIADTG